MNRPLQIGFVAALVLPPVLAASLDPAGASKVGAWLTYTFTGWFEPLFVLASCCLAVERVCYTVVWCCPGRFAAFCEAVRSTPLGGKTPVDVVVKFFTINKIFQYGGFAIFYHQFPRPTLFPFALVVGMQLVLIGQILNVGIYRAIGKAGVYYGCKFDQHAEWCTGFPFNVVTAHPQYLGSVLTTFGACLLLANDSVVERGWFGLAAMQALQYAYMAYVEHHL
ncbi:hypothetical protein CTAYLR_006399 [Chrysophaeum taylorii]|uniref:phosphatidyl-N-methylethanolamine N-methyltransferase n=1 Tax=Chrysophaeum taylorii TaxID=2483200 RepID=A0AAD7XI35_9STRA|nr:hypothetical protein CTAYLR_006399 [Chrysophaeum taylorii]